MLFSWSETCLDFNVMFVLRLWSDRGDPRLCPNLKVVTQWEPRHLHCWGAWDTSCCGVVWGGRQPQPVAPALMGLSVRCLCRHLNEAHDRRRDTTLVLRFAPSLQVVSTPFKLQTFWKHCNMRYAFGTNAERKYWGIMQTKAAQTASSTRRHTALGMTLRTWRHSLGKYGKANLVMLCVRHHFFLTRSSSSTCYILCLAPRCALQSSQSLVHWNRFCLLFFPN